MNKTDKLDKLALMCLFMCMISSAGTDTGGGCNMAKAN